MPIILKSQQKTVEKRPFFSKFSCLFTFRTDRNFSSSQSILWVNTGEKQLIFAALLFIIGVTDVPTKTASAKGRRFTLRRNFLC